jgi:glycosyltransferase involved in cell wall biosynthesis
MRIDYLSLHEASGYAVAARRCMEALAAAGAQVRWIPFVRGGRLGLGYEPADPRAIDTPLATSHLDSPRECDIVVGHLVPEYWPFVRAAYPRTPFVGNTAWETDRLPAHWPGLVDLADRVVVPVEWNAEVMRAAGVRKPITVVPHIAPDEKPRAGTAWDEIPTGAFVCYTIGPWTARKALPSVVRAYQLAFAGRSDTLLVVKTSRSDFSSARRSSPGRAGPGTTAWALARLLGEVREPAPVRLVPGDIEESEIDGLHAHGDCYVSLSRGEAWSLPVFDAAAHGNPVVVTGHGGPLAYLDPDTAFLVDHRLVAVDDPGNASYSSDQLWADASIEHAAALLRQVRDDPELAAARAARARIRIHRDFSATAVASIFLTLAATLIRGGRHA